MYPFGRCMKVIKGRVRNRNKPEGCIAEETIAEETIDFFSEYHKSMETIGIPPNKHETDENEEGKPLSAGKSNSSSDNNNSDSYSTSQISTSEEIDYDSPEPPKSLLKWYHYLLDEYKDNGRFWGSKSGSQASEASSKAKVEARGSKAKIQASTKTLIVKSPVRITNYVLGLANAKTRDAIKETDFE
ncbi:ribonuclease H-like domain, reverse transcriptase, RNA-dependent DNA polymerase [Tanacetum coccineum]